MGDLIDRQAAIDAVCNEWCGVKHQECEHMGIEWEADR